MYSFFTSSFGEWVIKRIHYSLGGIFMGTSLLACVHFWFDKSKSIRVFKIALTASFVGMCFIAIIYYVDHFFRIGELLEFGIQCALPIIYLTYLSSARSSVPIRLIKIAISFTFIGHGLYAMGYYPVPGYFIDMIINVFHVEESIARLILIIVGIADILAVVFIWLNLKPLTQISLWYMIVWGTLTALARGVANISFNLFVDGFNQWLFEVIIRLPHGILPFVLVLIFRHSNSRSSEVRVE